MKKTLYLFLLLATITQFANAKTIQIKSEHLNEKRNIYIQLPKDYSESKMDYPVIFLFDGQILFDYLFGLYQYNFDKYPQAILVGIEQIDRFKEFISPKNSESENINQKFSSFFLKELIPYIDANYRSNNMRIVIGHSHGGTFVLNSMLDSPLINGGISISPTIWVNNYQLLDRIKKNISESVVRNHLYLGCGEEDFDAIKKGIPLFKDKINELQAEKFSLYDEIYPNEDHNSSILIGMRKGLDYIFKDYIFPEDKWDELEETKQDSIFLTHFKQLSKQFGCELIPCEDDYNSLGYFYLENKEYKKAVAIFKKNIEYYPSSSNAYDSMGEAMEEAGDLDAALYYYTKAIKTETKEEANKYQLEQFKEHLYRVKSKNN